MSWSFSKNHNSYLLYNHVTQKFDPENEPREGPAQYHFVYVGSILTDYRKAKFKCIALADELKEEIPNRVHFDSVER